MEDEHRYNCEDLHVETPRVEHKHAADLNQEKVVAEEHLHVVDCAVGDVRNRHVAEHAEVAYRIVVGVNLSDGPVEPGDQRPNCGDKDEHEYIRVLEDDFGQAKFVLDCVFGSKLLPVHHGKVKIEQTGEPDPEGELNESPPILRQHLLHRDLLDNCPVENAQANAENFVS